MAKAIIWTKRASNRFDEIAQYLNEEWGEGVAQSFAHQTYRNIETLAEFPDMGPLENKKHGI